MPKTDLRNRAPKYFFLHHKTLKSFIARVGSAMPNCRWATMTADRAKKQIKSTFTFLGGFLLVAEVITRQEQPK
jgi:hypothetical protein